MILIELVELFDACEEPGWFTAQAMCYECGHTWQAAYPAECSPAVLQCSRCGRQNSITCDNQ